MSGPDAFDGIAEAWHEPGERVRALTDTAYESARAANHVFVGHRASEFGLPGLYGSIANVGLAIDSLRQNVTHLARILEQQGVEGHFHHDEERPVDDVIAAITELAARAAGQLAGAGELVVTLQSETAHLAPN
jgi:hypothetical protein